MKPFNTLTGMAVPFLEDNVDTDIILPARFLLHTEKQGLGRFAFYERRQQPGFVLEQPRYAGAKILIAGSNFGCGSSREQAPWALADLGLHAIIAPSFGEIFASNCAKNGVLAIPFADTAPLVETARARQPLTIDLFAQTIAASDATFDFAIDPGTREALLNGWDEITIILAARSEEISAFESAQSAHQPWLWSND